MHKAILYPDGYAQQIDILFNLLFYHIQLYYPY